HTQRLSHTHTHTHKSTQRHTHRHTHTHTHTRAHIHTYTHTQTHTHTHTQKHTCRHAHTHTHLQTNTLHLVHYSITQIQMCVTACIHGHTSITSLLLDETTHPPQSWSYTSSFPLALFLKN